MPVSLYLKSAVAAVALLTVTGGGAEAAAGYNDPAGNKAAITAVMFAYQDALNASDTEASLRLYAEDGVLMPPNNHSVVGKAAIRGAYVTGSKTFTLHVKFSIAEVVQMAPNWAFVRTNSAGIMRENATGAVITEGNQELFILRKEPDGKWKIARYSFSSTNPAP